MIDNDRDACGLLIRLLAISYDLILLFAVLILATALPTFIIDVELLQQSELFFPLYLAGCGYLYYVWHWVHGGQTLGMKAWRVRVLKQGSPPGWRDASIRFFLAVFSNTLLGFGLLWSIIDRDGMTFYERFSGTRLVRESRDQERIK